MNRAKLLRAVCILGLFVSCRARTGIVDETGREASQAAVQAHPQDPAPAVPAQRLDGTAAPEVRQEQARPVLHALGLASLGAGLLLALSALVWRRRARRTGSPWDRSVRSP